MTRGVVAHNGKRLLKAASGHSEVEIGGGQLEPVTSALGLAPSSRRGCEPVHTSRTFSSNNISAAESEGGVALTPPALRPCAGLPRGGRSLLAAAITGEAG